MIQLEIGAKGFQEGHLLSNADPAIGTGGLARGVLQVQRGVVEELSRSV